MRAIRLTACLLFAFSSPLLGQGEVRFSLQGADDAVEAGSRFTAIVRAEVTAGWHLYSMNVPEGGPIPTTISVTSSAVFSAGGDPVEPEPKVWYDENFGMNTNYFEDRVDFEVPVAVASDAPAGAHELEVKIRYMICNDSQCLPPQTVAVTANIRVREPAAEPSAALTPAFPAGAAPVLGEAVFELGGPEGPVEAGSTFEAFIDGRITPDWHLYSLHVPEGGPIPTTITVDENPVFSAAGDPIEPKPKIWYDENFGMETNYHERSVRFRLPVAVAAGAADGEQTLRATLRYQLCSDTSCLPPQNAPLTLAVQVAGVSTGGLTTASPAAAAVPVAQDPPVAVTGAAGLPAGLFAYLWFAFGAGALALLTPCVFPMIPITVSYFTKRETATRGKAVAEAGIYSLGIILTFTLLGLALTLAFGAGGINRLAASPWVNLLIAAIFIVFALSLFGVIELRLPNSWLNAVNRGASESKGVTGILLMALTFSLTSFTCTVPFVGTVMVAALHGDLLWSMLGVTAFATAFALPFFVLALFPSWLQALPQSGNWMNSVKVVMGFLELAAALKFISNIDLVFQWEIITRPVFITVWLSIALVTTVYLLGWFRFPHEMDSPSIGASRVLFAIFFLSVSFYLFRGLVGFPLGELDAFLPPRGYGETGSLAALLGPGGQGAPGTADEHWIESYEEGLAAAQKTGRPMFIDFTGYTCTNCRWMEANVFPQSDVQELFGSYVLVRLFTDGPLPEHAWNQQFERERFGTIALPFYAIVSPDEETIATFPGLTRDRSEFVRFLEGGLEQPVNLASGR